MIDRDAPIPTLDFATLPRVRRRRLQQLVKRCRTIGELLDRADYEDRKLLEDRLGGFRGSAPPPRSASRRAPQIGGADDPPAITAPEAAWRAWAEHHTIPAVLDLQAEHVVPMWELAYGERSQSVLQVLLSSKARIHMRQRLRQQVSGLAVRAQSTREWERQRMDVWLRAPHPLLTPAWLRVVDDYKKRRQHGLPIGLEPATIHLDPESLTLDVHVRAHGWYEPEVFEVLWFEPSPALSLDDTGEHPMAVLTGLLEFFTNDSDAARREALIAQLSIPPWERSLEGLERHVIPEPLDPEEDKTLLGFELDNDPHVRILRAVQCRPKKRGDGYVTRRVEVDDLPEVLARDPEAEPLLRHLRTPGPHGVGQALMALVGHPRVFFTGSSTKGAAHAVRRGRLALALRHRGAAITVGFELDGEPLSIDRDPRFQGFAGDVGVFVGDGQIVVVPVRRGLRAALQFLQGRAPVEVPIGAVPRLVRRLPELAQAAPVDADDGVLGARVTGDVRPLLALRWEGDGLVVQARIHPLPEAEPWLPGEGPDFVCAQRGDTLVHHRRDLNAEPREVERALEPLGLRDADRVGGFSWAPGEPQAALAVLEAIQAHQAAFQVRWDSDSVAVGRRAQGTDLRVRVSSGRDWFGVSGELDVDGARVDLGRLLQAALAGHRFVPVSKGKWVALSDALRERLAAAAATATPEGKGDVRLTALHAPVIEALSASGAEVEAPPEWTALSARMAEARTLEPQVPEGLACTLRPYQEQGFTWLARLAHWAPGACLADDMGLGKTVQAIALLLHRIDEGPALVVAPTAVIHNWRRELERFAPDLRPVLYHGTQRAGLLDGLGRGDVVVTTYGVMINEIEAIRAIHFGVAVLDESQAIANPDTRRSQAARELDAGFRLALSGTPIQNRVSELWALFAFIAPGYLGSRNAFVDRFVKPIELRHDTERRALLAEIAGPLMLRRTKGQVAPELPPRSDEVYPVELTEHERAGYERARLDALTRIAAAPPKKRSFQVLEELTRLRMLACAPMVDAGDGPRPSSKLKSTLRILRDLREAEHQVLVFSSFVSHLEVVRETLEAEGFVVRYLDGSTPPGKRQAEVDAFQAGQGHVFLISLKAGGVGLNLTAATYVLHLDPWWNPAAEDQGSDRAHRIGQDQPVTVYRLVSRDTIEDQIVAMHAHKRQLAEALLSGAGSTHMPSTDELVAMLSQASTASTGGAAPGRPRLTLIDGGASSRD